MSSALQLPLSLMFRSLQKFPTALGFSLCVCVQGFLAVLGSLAQDRTAVVVSEFLLAGSLCL